MRMNYFDLFSFAKATPLVQIKNGQPVAVSDETHFDFNMKRIMTDLVNAENKQLKVKFDILNESFLENIACNGSRLLHITSDIWNWDKDKLWIEGQNGIGDDVDLVRL